MIPKGLVVLCHICENHICVTLFLSTVPGDTWMTEGMRAGSSLAPVAEGGPREDLARFKSHSPKRDTDGKVSACWTRPRWNQSCRPLPPGARGRQSLNISTSLRHVSLRRRPSETWDRDGRKAAVRLCHMCWPRPRGGLLGPPPQRKVLSAQDR